MNALPAVVLALMLLAAHAADVPTTTRQSFPVFTREGCLNLPTLVCSLQPTEAFPATKGTVFFAPVYQRRRPDSELFTCFTRITAEVSGLSNNKHGFHIHTYGDVTAEDGTSTGGHFSNPAGDEIAHGFSNNGTRHWGDLDNLDADADGNASYQRVDKVIRLGGILGRGITVHEAEDQGPDMQPTGAAGARVGVCVIGYANPDLLL